MKQQVLFAAVAATLFAAPVHAIKINDHAMVANVANPANVGGSAANVYDTLRTASLASQFDAVGRLGDCTATWLGAEGDYAWVLTAARCVRNTNLVHNADHLVFTNKDGIALAGGAGSTSYIHANRINKPSSVRDAGTDIALVRMKRLPASNTHAPVAPVLYNGTAEANVPVGFVSHGPVVGAGVGMTAAWPTTGERRAWGESVVGSTTELGHALYSRFTMGSATHWAGVSEGDAGSPWFQQRNGEWQIVGATSGGTMVQSNGVRVSKYARWINDLFPGVQLSSEPRDAGPFTAEVTESAPFDHTWSAAWVYFVGAPGQPGVEAPSTGIHNGLYATTRLVVPIVNVRTGQTSKVVLNGQRNNGCMWALINDMTSCSSDTTTSRLLVQYLASENAILAPGQWRGRLDLDGAHRWGGIAPFRLGLDIELNLGSALATKTQAMTTHDLGYGVYFTIPTQAGVSGPSSAHLDSKATTGLSMLTVSARDAVTQRMVPIKLRAQRNNGCRDIAMNNAAVCQGKSNLKIWFEPSDNPTLTAGRYGAKFDVQARGWYDKRFNITTPVELDIDMLP